MSTKPLPELMKINEVAQALRLSRSTIYRLIAEGKLEVVHPSERATRIKRDSVLRLLGEPVEADGGGRP